MAMKSLYYELHSHIAKPFLMRGSSELRLCDKFSVQRFAFDRNLLKQRFSNSFFHIGRSELHDGLDFLCRTPISRFKQEIRSFIIVASWVSSLWELCNEIPFTLVIIEKFARGYLSLLISTSKTMMSLMAQRNSPLIELYFEFYSHLTKSLFYWTSCSH